MASSAATTVTAVPSKHIDDELAANYDALVADPNRGLTYEQVAVDAAAANDPLLAAWARERAAAKTRPEEPEVVPVTIDYDALKVDDLKEIAEQRGIDVSGLKLKGDLTDALVDWDQAQPAATYQEQPATQHSQQGA